MSNLHHFPRLINSHTHFPAFLCFSLAIFEAIIFVCNVVQEMGIIGSNICSLIECMGKVDSPDPIDVAPNGECVHEKCQLPTDQMPTAYELGPAANFQAQRAGSSVKQKKHNPSHGKLNSSSIPGIQKLKLDRCWSSDDVGIACKVKYNRAIDPDHEFQSNPALQSCLQVSQILSRPLPGREKTQIIVPEYRRAEPEKNVSYTNNCGSASVVIADIVTINPAVHSSQSWVGDTMNSSSVLPELQPRVPDNSVSSSPIPSSIALPVPYVRRTLGQCSECPNSSDLSSNSFKVAR
jgi:hypothetical protein